MIRSFIASTAIALGVFVATPSSAQTAADNKAAVGSAFEAWRAGTGSPFELLADDASWTIEGNSVASKTYPTKQAFIDEVIAPFNARMAAGIRPSVKSIIAEADRVVIYFDAQGTARDGKPYVNTYAWFFQMKDGRVIRASAFFDAIAFNDLWARVSPSK